MLCPYKGGKFRLTQPFKTGVHTGMDLVGLSSKELIAVCDAVVLQSRIVTDRTDLTWQWGNYVALGTPEGYRVIYAHLSKRKVKKGDVVRRGDVIGVEGDTGYSFGSHCHLEVRDNNNKATAAVNTPSFTEIPNLPGVYDASDAGISAQLAGLDRRVAALEDACRVYHYYSELPDYARDTIERLHRTGVFAGGGPGDMQLTYGMMRILLILAWRGII